MTITYRKLRRYKYQLRARYQYQLPDEYADQLEREHGAGWVRLSASRVLSLTAGYAWDGPSGLTIDTKTFMRGSLVHDALYQLLRADQFTRHEHWREIADDILRRICREDGMNSARVWWVHRAVRLGGRKAAEVDPYAEPPILNAP